MPSEKFLTGLLVAPDNVFNLETLRAVMEAAEAEDSPVIVLISENAHTFLSPINMHIRFFMDFAAGFRIPVMFHHDYLNTIEDCIQAIDLGFSSVSFNGAALPYKENVEKTRQISQYAHQHRALVESELGCVPGAGFGGSSVFTDPGIAAQFVMQSGCDVLAVSAGTSHGGIKGSQPLQIEHGLLKEIKKQVKDIPLALHGAASRPWEYEERVNRYGGEVGHLCMATEEDLQRTRHNGVAKLYMDADNWLSVTGAIRKCLVQYPERFHPLEYCLAGANAMKEAVRHKMRHVTMSTGYGSKYYHSLIQTSLNGSPANFF